MQVAITARHGHVSDETHEYISRKAGKLLTYFERVTAIQVTLDFEDDRVSTELLVDAEHKHSFVARVTGSEVIPTFDQTLHKMEQQIRKYKQKIQDHRRDRPLKDITEETETESEEE